MIHVFKDENNIPRILLSERTQKAIEEIKNNNISPRLANIYRHSEIKQHLDEIYNGKCAYCEWKPQILEIKQYIPKSINPLLAFNWNNLLLTCPVCNRNKANQFPTTAEGEALLLNPERDQPEKHLSFHSDGQIYGITKRGEITIGILKLNRETLIRDRAYIYNSLFDIFTNYLQTLQNVIDESSIETEKTAKILNIAFDYLFKELISRTKASSEYALFGRYIFNNFETLFIEKSDTNFSKLIFQKAFHYFKSKKEILEKDNKNTEKNSYNPINLNIQYQQLIKEIYRQNNPEEIFDIQNLITILKQGNSLQSKFLIENVYNGNMPYKYVPYIRVSELASDSIDYKIDITKAEYCVLRTDKIKLIEKSVILVSLIGKNLKPSYFEYNNKPITIGNDILALNLKKNISLEYFIMQLNSKFVNNQVETLIKGVIKRISKKDFLNISIPIPSIEVQLREILEIKSILAEKFIAKLEIDKQVSKTRAVEHNIIATLSHNFNQKLGSLVNDLDTLTKYLTKKDASNKSISFLEPIAPVFEGEDIKNVDTLSLVVNRLTDNLKDATQTIKAIERVYQKKISKKRTNIITFFEKEIKKSFKSDKFSIEIINPENLKALFVEIDKPAFKEAIQNLIKNAEKHGFIENKQYAIQFEISKLQAVDYISITYRNNGVSFPKGFTFEEFKQPAGKAGNNKGTGIGGAFIYEVIQLHNGKLKYIEVDNNDSNNFNVQFEILLPKIKK